MLKKKEDVLVNYMGNSGNAVSCLMNEWTADNQRR